MATSANKNYSAAGGSPGSAGTDEVRVDRINESLTGESTIDNETGNLLDPVTPTRNILDSFKATGGRVARQTGTIYTDTEVNWSQEIADVTPPTESFNH